jgi:hypothetical protein
MLACMAEPIDRGQQIATYLLLHLLPLVIFFLTCHTIPRDPMLLNILAAAISKGAVWRL